MILGEIEGDGEEDIFFEGGRFMYAGFLLSRLSFWNVVGPV